jgi:hypothetical protein
MMTVVQAIASQMIATDPNDFVRRFSEGIRALPSSQDPLVRSGWQGVAIKCSDPIAPFSLQRFDRYRQTSGPHLRCSALRFAPASRISSQHGRRGVDRSPQDYVLWFRPELLSTVTWAGNPAKAVEAGDESRRMETSKWLNPALCSKRTFKSETQNKSLYRGKIGTITLRNSSPLQPHKRSDLMVSESVFYLCIFLLAVGPVLALFTRGSRT